MRYMLLVCDDGTEGPGPAEIDAAPGHAAWRKQIEERGVTHHGVRLRPPAEAVTVRVRDGELFLSDGPFAETREQVCGYDVIDCADLDEAIEVASKHPVATFGAIELRPIWTE